VAEARLAIQAEYSLAEALERGLPYFGRQLAAFQSPPIRYAVLAQLTRQVFRERTTADILEVGSWAGASAVTLGSVVRELGKKNGRILCVDCWEPYFAETDSSFHYAMMTHAMVSGQIEQLFLHNVRVCGLDKLIEVRKVDSRIAQSELDPETFDFVYIDGSHKKDDLMLDIQQAMRLVRKGGIICGDDLELARSEVDPAAHRAALATNQDFVLDPLTGRRYHPGVTEAVAASFHTVWARYGLWCVEREGDGWKAPRFDSDDFEPEKLEIPDHLQHAVEIPYGTIHGYEVFQLGKGFVGYPMESPCWFQNRVLARSLDEMIALLEAIDQMETLQPRLVESRQGVNIVRHRGKYWAIEQSVGPVDFRNAEHIERLRIDGQIYEAETKGEAWHHVMARRLMAQVEAMRHVVEARLAELAGRVAEQVAGVGARVGVVEAAQADAARQLMAQVEAMRHDVEARLAELGALLPKTFQLKWTVRLRRGLDWIRKKIG
jgi:predicted O-methyltransferase YrrM